MVEQNPHGADIMLDPNNANRGTVRGRGMVERSLSQYGAGRSILISADDVALAGNKTLETARELGIPVQVIESDGTTLYAIKRTDLPYDDPRARELAIADNRAGEVSLEWDADVLQSFVDDGIDLEQFWFADELAEVLAGDDVPIEGLTDPDEVPEPPIDPITKPGDLWLLGEHRLYCGDSRDFSDVQHLFGGELANVVVTSPPYASQRTYDPSSGFRPIHPDAYVDWYRDLAANVMAVLAPDGSYFLNIKEHADEGQRSLYVKDLTIAHVREWGWMFVDEFCWRDTKNGVPGGWPNRFKDAWEPVFHFTKQASIKFHPLANGSDSDAVFEYSSDTAKTKTGSGLLGVKATQERKGKARPSNVIEIAAASTGDHSAAYPVELPAWFIRAFSEPGDIVYDPFMGSGTTLIAAEQESRRSFGMEISPAYCDVIVRRWEEFTGQAATRESPALHEAAD